MTKTKKKWFRILAPGCPLCGMKVNVDRLTNGPPQPVTELIGHSVISYGRGRITNLMGQVRDVRILKIVNEQLALKLVELLKLMAVDMPWLKPYVAQQLEIESFGERYVKPITTELPVEEAQWQQKVEELNLEVEASPVRDVTKALNQVGLSAPSAPSLSWDNSPLETVLEQEVEGVDPKKLAELLARHGGRTSGETGA